MEYPNIPSVPRYSERSDSGSLRGAPLSPPLGVQGGKIVISTKKGGTEKPVPPFFVEMGGLVSGLHSALQDSRKHCSTLKKCRCRYWILPKFVTFL